MSRRAMIHLESIVDLERKNGLSVPSVSVEAMAVMYEEGMNKVLREIVRRHLKVCDGFEVERSEEYELKMDQKEKIYNELLAKLRDEKQKDLLHDLASEFGYLSLIEMDGAYTEGFLAGYRFLKELHPD